MLFAIVWIFYYWITVNFHIFAKDALFTFSWEAFFFLNKGFSNELGFAVCKGNILH